MIINILIGSSPLNCILNNVLTSVAYQTNIKFPGNRNCQGIFGPQKKC